jgi:hypothetical protein
MNVSAFRQFSGCKAEKDPRQFLSRKQMSTITELLFYAGSSM